MRVRALSEKLDTKVEGRVTRYVQSYKPVRVHRTSSRTMKGVNTGTLENLYSGTLDNIGCKI